MKGYVLQRPPYETGRIWISVSEVPQTPAGFRPTGAEMTFWRTRLREVAAPAPDDWECPVCQLPFCECGELE